MTLDELLALLPDNTTGEIDAADLRTIVTELWSQGADIEARVAFIEAEGGSGGTAPSVTGVWQIAAGGTPGGQQVASDTDDFSTTTSLRFDSFDQSNTDMTTVLNNAVSIFAQQQSDAGNWARYTVSGEPTVNGSYVEVPVTVDDFGGVPGAAAWQTAIFVISLAGS